MHVELDRAFLKELREEHAYSISDMAAYLGYKTPTGYWLIEHGNRRVPVDGLYKLAQLFDKTMEELLRIEED